MSTVAPPSGAVARLQAAWRGEIEAQSVYTILAERIVNQRRGQVIREIANAVSSWERPNPCSPCGRGGRPAWIGRRPA